MALSIACVSSKGGVGKTTTCVSLAGAFAQSGKRVLAVDMDPQANLTEGLGLDPDELGLTVAALLVGNSVNPGDVVIATRWAGISLLPASADLLVVAEALGSTHHELALCDALTRSGGAVDFDVVIFDTPPGMGFCMASVMAATDHVLVPMQMSGFALKGLQTVLHCVRTVRQQFNPGLRVLGVLPTFVDKRTRFSQEVLEGLHEVPGLHIFDSYIGVNVELQESALAGMPITAFAPASAPAVSYRHLVAEIESWLESSHA